MKKFFFTLIFSLSFFSFSFAEKVTDLKATDYVNDYTNTLTADQKLELSKTLGALEKQTGDQVAVFMIKSMDGDYIEHYAVQLYQQLGLSTKDKQMGVLFLIAKDDHQMRIEVGYGLEPTLTDGITKNILDNFVRPQFKNNNYFEGTKVGVDSIATVLNGGTIPELSTDNSNSSSPSTDWFTIIIFVLVFGVNILGWLFAIMARTKSWWLGGVATFVLGFPILYFFFGLNIIGDIILFLTTISGFVFDYFISKNYKYWQQKIPINSGTRVGPAWWAGGTWGPGGSGGGSGFGGFGGGGFSGGGGSSSSW